MALPLAICTPASDAGLTAVLLLVAAVYIGFAGTALLLPQRSIGFWAAFGGGALLGALPLGMGVLARNLEAPYLWGLAPALLVLPVVVFGGVRLARRSGHPAPTPRAWVAALLGLALPTVAAVLSLFLAISTGATCID